MQLTSAERIRQAPFVLPNKFKMWLCTHHDLLVVARFLKSNAAKRQANKCTDSDTSYSTYTEKAPSAWRSLRQVAALRYDQVFRSSLFPTIIILAFHSSV